MACIAGCWYFHLLSALADVLQLTTHPLTGWMKKEMQGLSSFMNEHKEIRSGNSRAMPPGWTKETDNGIRVGGIVSCTAGIGVLPSTDDLVICVPALADAAALGPGKIIAVHTREGSCVVEHLDGGIRREYSIGRYHEFHLATYSDFGARKYYFEYVRLPPL